MKKIPTVDISNCNMCLSCISVCPEVFIENSFGIIEVLDKQTYPKNKVEEAIKYCPKNCIDWELSNYSFC